MVRLTHHGKAVGASVERRASTSDPRAVGLAAAGFLPLLAAFFGCILYVLFGNPSGIGIAAGFIGAFASVGGAIGWVAFALSRSKPKP